MVVHTFNLGTWQVEASGSQGQPEQVSGQLELHSETLALKRKKGTSKLNLETLQLLRQQHLLEDSGAQDKPANL